MLKLQDCGEHAEPVVIKLFFFFILSILNMLNMRFTSSVKYSLKESSSNFDIRLEIKQLQAQIKVRTKKRVRLVIWLKVFRPRFKAV